MNVYAWTHTFFFFFWKKEWIILAVRKRNHCDSKRRFLQIALDEEKTHPSPVFSGSTAPDCQSPCPQSLQFPGLLTATVLTPRGWSPYRAGPPHPWELPMNRMASNCWPCSPGLVQGPHALGACWESTESWILKALPKGLIGGSAFSSLTVSTLPSDPIGMLLALIPKTRPKNEHCVLITQQNSAFWTQPPGGWPSGLPCGQPTAAEPVPRERTSSPPSPGQQPSPRPQRQTPTMEMKGPLCTLSKRSCHFHACVHEWVHSRACTSTHQTKPNQTKPIYCKRRREREHFPFLGKFCVQLFPSFILERYQELFLHYNKPSEQC